MALKCGPVMRDAKARLKDTRERCAALKEDSNVALVLEIETDRLIFRSRLLIAESRALLCDGKFPHGHPTGDRLA